MRYHVSVLVLGLFLTACAQTEFSPASLRQADSESYVSIASSLGADNSEKKFLCFLIPEKVSGEDLTEAQVNAPRVPLLCRIDTVSESALSGTCVDGEVSEDRKQINYANGESVATDIVIKIASPDLRAEATREFFSNPKYPPLRVTVSEGSITVSGSKGMDKPEAKDACIPARL